MGKSTEVKVEKSKFAKDKDSIAIPQIHIRRVTISIVGTSPLITHAWSEKAKKQMRDKQTGAAKQKKEAKDPMADFEAAKYLDAKGRDCVPSLAFKNAIVSAARYADDMKMTMLRGALFIEGELLPIEYDECVMREDMVRVGGMSKTADIRYRPAYHGWRVSLPIQYNERALSLEQLTNLIQLAGFSIGICEWRPEKRGDFGRFALGGQVAA
jgi:hypothetical protein